MDRSRKTGSDEILIVGTDSLGVDFSDQNIDARSVPGSNAALDVLERAPIACLVFTTTGPCGVDDLTQVRELAPGTPIILVAEEEDTVAEAVELGVTDRVWTGAPAWREALMNRVLNVLNPKRNEAQPDVDPPDRLLRSVFEESPDALLLANDEGRYVEANPAACELFGLDREELLGHRLDEFAAEDYNFEREWDSFREGDTGRGTFPLVRPDGEERLVEYRATQDLLPDRHLSVLRDITDHRQIRQELDETFERVTDGFFALDQKWRFTYLNERATELLGASEAELLGRTLWVEFPEAVGSNFEDQYRWAVERGERVAFKEYYPPLDAWFSVQAYPSATGMSVYFRDVTEVVDRDEQFRQLTEHIDQAFWMIDADYEEYVYYSPEFETIWGDTFDGADDIRWAFLETIHPDDRERIAAGLDRQISGDYDVEYRIVRPDGEVRWIRDKAAPITNASGEVYRIAGVCEDVTERKKRERELLQYETAVESLDEAVWSVDTDGRLTFVTEPIVDVTDSAQEELLGRQAADILAEDVGLTESEVESFERRIEGVLSGEREKAVLELRLPLPAGEVIRDVRIVPLRQDDTIEGAVGINHDVTARVERENELELFRNLIDESNDIICVVDPDTGRLLDVNETACRDLGYVRERLLEMTFGDLETGSEREPAWRSQVAEARREAAVLRRNEFCRSDGTTYPVELHTVFVTLDREYVVTIGRDVTERRQYERTLTALHDASLAFQHVESADEIARTVVETATSILDLSGVTVYLYDAEENVLRSAAESGEIQESYDGALPPIPPGDESITGHVFLEGETTVFDDVHDSEFLHDDSDGDLGMRSGLFVPLGGHGILVAGDSEPATFDERTMELAELLAATAEAALDRVAREFDLIERRREIKKQSERLDRLEQIHEKLQMIHDVLLGSDGRRDIQREICSRLAAVDRFSFVWIGEHDPVTNTLEPVATGGEEKGYLEAIDLDVTAGTEPALMAARDQTDHVVETIGVDIGPDPWRREALSRDYRSAIALPLVYDGVFYGVLSIYADRAGAFESHSRDILSDSAHLVAYAINGAERKRALLSELGIELEFEVTDPDWPLLALARRAGRRLALEGVVPGDPGEMLYVTVTSARPDQVVDRLHESAPVDHVRLVGHDDDRTSLEVGLRRTTIGDAIAGHGFVLEGGVADGHEARLTIRVPTSAEVHTAVETMKSVLPESELVAKRERPAEDARTVNGSDGLLSRLTPRQREVVQAAYYSGFFESPRRSTGGEVAETLGISPPTFHSHVREAHRRLLEAVLGSPSEAN